MISGSVTSTLRPIRIAFVIAPWDRAAALRAMQISTFLWGGTYNPIIPYHQRLGRKNPFHAGASKAQEIFEGYLRAYDPDFVVRLGKTKSAKVDLGRYTEIDEDGILGKALTDATPGYGVGLFELLRHLFDEEFSFVRREKVAFEIPDVQESLLWTSMFGDVPQELREAVESHLRAFPDYQQVSLDEDTYLNTLRRDNHFILRLGRRFIEHEHTGERNDRIFLMDGNSVEDIVFYWNLRALGWNIIPLPLKASTCPGTKSRIEKYIEVNHWPLRGNPSMFNHTTLLKAPSISEEDHRKFADSLKLKKPKKKDLFGPLSIQPWIPRIWDEWDRERNRGRRTEIYVERNKVKFSPEGKCFEVPPILPEFAEDFGGQGTPRCANGLEIRIYGETGTYAESIPEGGDLIARALHRYSIRGLRCSANGPVVYPAYKGSELRLELPLAESVFQAWFKERDWDTTLSDNGHIVKHVLKQFGGMWGTRMLEHEEVLRLLDKISATKWFEKKAFSGLIHKCANQVNYLDPDYLTSWLVKSNIVKLGIELTCPQCRQRSWYSIKEANYKLECRQCLESFTVPCEDPDKIKWAYRGHGAFTSRYGTQGGLAVLLTLKMFSQGSLNRVTPMLSFNAKNGDKEMEIDLALHTSRERSGGSKQNVFFIECKSYNEFEKKDIQRMEWFSRQFPGTAMVFSTLRRELTPKESSMLTPVCQRACKARLTGKPSNPLIILTGTELFSSTEPWNTWRELDGKYQRYQHWPYQDDEAEALAEATQFLYLGFDTNEFIHRHRSQKPSTTT